jgi:hypothetical protein
MICRLKFPVALRAPCSMAIRILPFALLNTQVQMFVRIIDPHGVPRKAEHVERSHRRRTNREDEDRQMPRSVEQAEDETPWQWPVLLPPRLTATSTAAANGVNRPRAGSVTPRAGGGSTTMSGQTTGATVTADADARVNWAAASPVRWTTRSRSQRPTGIVPVTRLTLAACNW